MANEDQVTIIDGTKDTSTFPRKSSLSEIGMASRASMVLLSFSPAKLSAAMTVEANKGMIRKNGASRYTRKR